MNVLIVLLLVGFSGLFSGLNLAFLGLHITDLEIKKKLGNKDAHKVLPVRKKTNLLLCTILVANTAVNATLSIFLTNLATGILAGCVSTALIVTFGEILPQSIFSKCSLWISARTLWLIKLFIFLFYPVTAPMVYVLDRYIGTEGPTVYSKRELIEIIKYQEDLKSSAIDQDEEEIVIGALSFSEKTVAQVLTPRTVVFALERNTLLSAGILAMIREKGLTRIPVYEDKLDKICGILYTKRLIGTFGKSVNDCFSANVLKISESTKLDKALNLFIKNKTHMAFVFDDTFGGLEGIVTLEDVLEEIIGREIVDETDTVTDYRAEAKKQAEL